MKAELVSHFDGYIESTKDLSQTLSEINGELEKMTGDQIEKQIYQKFEYLVCQTCRDELARFLELEEIN